MKAVFLTVTVACLALGMSCSPISAQTKEQGEALFKEGDELAEKAQSKQDLESALKKYEEALRVFEKVGAEKSQGVTLNNIGELYRSLGQYDKALEYYDKSLTISTKIGNLRGEGVTLSNIGQVYKSQGQYAEALEHYEKSLEIMRKIGDVKGEGVIVNNIAVVYYSWSQYPKALEYYEKSLDIRRKIGDVKGEGITLSNMGVIYHAWGQYPKALECHEKSLEIKQKAGDTQGEGIALNNIAGVYGAWGQYPQALNYYEKSLEMMRQIGDVQTEGTTLSNIGGVYGSLGQYTKALEHYHESLEIFRKIGDVPNEAVTLGNIGLAHKTLGQYDKALEYYEKSLGIKRKVGDERGEGVDLNNIGGVYLSWGQYAKALEYYGKALEIRRRVGDVQGEGVTLSNIGLVYKSWGQYAKALECYEKDLEITRKIGDVPGERIAQNNIGGMYYSWGQYAKALETFENSLEICRKVGDLKGEGVTLANIAAVQAQQGDYDKALAKYQESLAVKIKIGVPTDGTRDLIGNIYLDMGKIDAAEPIIKEAGFPSSLGRLSLMKTDFGQAREYYGKLLTSAEESLNVDSSFSAHTGLGAAYEALGDLPKAEEHYRKAVDLTEEVRSRLTRQQAEKFFDVRIEGFPRTAPYEGLARVQIKMNRPVEAFKTSEYTKARVFAESMSRLAQGAAFNIPAEVLEGDGKINDQLAALKKRRQEAYEKGNQEIISVIGPQVKELETKFEGHVKMLREKYPIFAATKYPQPMDLQQTALQDAEWVLAYHVTDSGIIVYLTKGKELVTAVFKPVAEAELNSLVLKFREPLEIVAGRDNFEKKLKSFDAAAGRRVATLVLDEALRHLPPQTPVVIVPDGSLGALPFEMLVLNEGAIVKTDRDLPCVTGAEFFGDRNTISYYQSVTALTLARIHAKEKAAHERLLVVADPVFHENDTRASNASKSTAPKGVLARLFGGLMAAEQHGQLGGLRFTRLARTEELAKWLKQVHGKEAVIHTGLEVNKADLLDKIAPELISYDKVVFATHGYFGKDLPGIMEPVLVLSLVPPGTDGYLRMTEVMGLNMNADMVALIACQSGLGKRVSGEGTMGMGRAFQYAGAKSVLMSLWSVSEVASVNLVKSFFRHLREGRSKTQSLFEARRELRSRGFDHPFFWAGFILVGEAN